ncbi:Peptidyl-prolyl cis-trans isomerase-like 4 [Hypsibius exemplaris]|uniref:Peptidyl-prolyl cis-trans isomerase n=1 Tax=Hypsibius exemplaris TaxID=2072580 RepID=A0A1W0WSW6_HYPEX|nr:Peptidyl-prolyl cis-trans isomerase-like 4 [Hypsibius exemplaris]
MSVILETSIGDITVDLHIQERPRACLNFLKLCKIKYYNYCLLFNIQRDFIAQTGDPTNTGKGGESVFSKIHGEKGAYFEPETMPPMRHVKIGTVSFANNGSNMHGSQFFITLGENLDYLDDVHTVFGEVSEGLEVLQKLNETIVDDGNRPYQDIRINHTVILDDPFDDPRGLKIPARSPSPTPEQLETGRIAPGEDLDEYGGKTKEEVEEAVKEKEAKARAQILEMIGDLPDADVKPPDNVLFVCKLNAVTTDDDLLIIFSRFGPIKKCEVIRDQKSGDSLQYAFIEFENEDDCASAFFKMDNVLIDDRRIHVDFSQSVSKLNWVTNRQKQPPSGAAERSQPTSRGRDQREPKQWSAGPSQRTRSPVRRRSPIPEKRRKSPEARQISRDRRISPAARRPQRQRSRSRSASRERNSKRRNPSPQRSPIRTTKSSHSGGRKSKSSRRSSSSSSTSSDDSRTRSKQRRSSPPPSSSSKNRRSDRDRRSEKAHSRDDRNRRSRERR